ncbi:hypothetical protein [Streptomyces sp. YIM 132580]|uniref:hypothetical protein n=1 Tax=Streptomyces sp. YIM 132580 TaxID=2691958 RepID=UPI003FCCCDF7
MAGALLVTAGPMLGIYTVVRVETYGWTSAHTLGLGALALALPAALVIGAVSLGLAVLSTLAAARTEALTAAGPPSAEALTGGHRLACTVGAALLVAAFAVASVVVRRKPASTLNPTEARTG